MKILLLLVPGFWDCLCLLSVDQFKMDEINKLLVTPQQLTEIHQENHEDEGDEELYKDFSNMREFHVLDEIETTANEDDEGKENRDSDSSSYNDADSEADYEIKEDEIDAMLEEGLPDELKSTKRFKRGDGTAKPANGDASMAYEEKEKIVLEEKGKNHFEVLPENWVQVTHNSGMPIYLHKPTRVCTLAKPYFLGPGSARKHAVPISAVPCLHYRKAKEKEEQKAEELQNTIPSERDVTVVVAPEIPCARIESVQENQAAHSLNGVQLREYCSNLFHFKTVRLMRFKTWAARRKHTKLRKQRQTYPISTPAPGLSSDGLSMTGIKQDPHEDEDGKMSKTELGRPTLPKGTKLITFPIGHSVPSSNNDPTSQTEGQSAVGPPGGSRREWIMNPAGKSYVCILHEYVQHALKKQPAYQFKEIENAATPYSATVLINGMQYGTGVGSSKKAAKAEAAKATLEVLIPQMKEKILDETEPGHKGPTHQSDLDLSFFNEIRIEDPRVAELCAKTSEPSPYAILLTCLQRNFGLGDKNVKYELRTLKHQKNEVIMTVGKHTVQVPCKNKRDGKQRAAQAILQALHPHISSWGSLLRLYGSHSLKTVKEKKQEEQQITLLQSKAAVNAPNYAILNKLRQEMLKLRQMREAVQPIGRFIPPDDVGMPSTSGADLKNVDL
uniref:EOG090X04U5 n=1 Tax=Simocephalus serrulatus TaxID=117539 RepID=A0A4Y7NLR1_9CRUS|nr:EOG090X04U5 [Simocephalus serrulatus]SVE94191.1 EOG090X04U5 [Simocephalus serrulatus]